MTFEKKIADVFRLTDENWMRHANPLSVWTRYSVLPLIIMAFWSRLWIGWWCLLPGTLSILWMFLNPIVFKAPKTTKNWASKAVLGERVYLNRDNIPLPAHHNTPLYTILNGISSVGFLLAVWSTVYFSVWGAISGIAMAYLGKSWFLDRMVWLYEDMKNLNQTYQNWEY
ncbi:DUF6653 family protein [Vibrio salinus]|uniref:DUF6653 family protein n=1 Tax=Vibrio salinus TaxID=2899784 RepID=UPI001E526B38|nr:DUF6653 family protein [Vibrio salinus]MCE0494880.1 hypothetical protein [Vibrio salinus]